MCNLHDPLYESLLRDLEALEVLRQRYPTLNWQDEDAVLVHSAYNALANTLAEADWKRRSKKRWILPRYALRLITDHRRQRTCSAAAKQVSFINGISGQQSTRDSACATPYHWDSSVRGAFIVPYQSRMAVTSADPTMEDFDSDHIEDMHVLIGPRTTCDPPVKATHQVLSWQRHHIVPYSQLKTDSASANPETCVFEDMDIVMGPRTNYNPAAPASNGSSEDELERLPALSIGIGSHRSALRLIHRSFSATFLRSES